MSGSQTSTSRIVMLLANAYKPDPRVQREAAGLVAAGHRVTLICWDRAAELSQNETINGIEIIRVQNVRSAYGSGWRQLFYLPRFWQKAIAIASQLQPSAVHAHDLDTLFAGYRIKQRAGCPLVYDAHEHYPALMSLYLPRPMVLLLTRFERWLLRHVDATITASTILNDEFAKLGVEPCITLGNFPVIAPYLNPDAKRVDTLRQTLDQGKEQLHTGYIASFSRNRMLLPFIHAASQLPQVQFHIWGDGLQRADVENAVADYPNAHYHGWATPVDLPIYFAAMDLIYYALRLDYPGAIYNAPNTLAQAMAAARPIIGTDVGDLGRIVRATDCGILIEQATADSIAQAIRQLADPETRHRLGKNGRNAARKTYNARATQQQLTTLYQKLLESRLDENS